MNRIHTTLTVTAMTLIALAMTITQAAAQSTTIDNSCIPSAVPCDTLIDNSDMTWQLVQSLIDALCGLLG